MIRNFIIRLSKLFHEKKIFAFLKNQRGMMPTMLALSTGVVGLGVIKAVQTKMDRSGAEQKFAVNKLHLEYANETALSQVSQLLGSGVLNINESNQSNLKFVANSKIPSETKSKMMSGLSFRPEKEAARSWSLDMQSGEVQVDSCLRMNYSENQLNQIFSQNNSNESWLGEGSCSDNLKITTTIKPERVLAADSIPGESSKTAIVRAKSVLGGSQSKSKQLDKKARIRFLPPSQICDFESGEDQEYCNVDHCRFMKPVQVGDEAADGEVAGDIYLEESEGKMTYQLMPNPDYKAILYLPAPSSIPQITVNTPPGQDPPENLKKFYDEAVAPGLNDPFAGWQGVEGHAHVDDYITGDRYEGDRVKFSIPAYSKKGQKITVDNVSTQGAFTFEGFLYYDSQTQGDSGSGSRASEWKKSNTAMDQQLLKEGCLHTVGHADADFCAKVKLSYSSFKYSYEQKRRCYYYGPENVSKTDFKLWLNKKKSTLDASNLKSWQVRQDYSDAGDWKESSASQSEKKYLSATNIVPFEDDPLYWHHETNEYRSIDKESSKVAFDRFPDYYFQTKVDVKEIVKNPSYIPPKNTDPNDPPSEEPAPPPAPANGIKTEYMERDVTYEWNVSCNIEPVIMDEKIDGKKAKPAALMASDKCYYIVYRNSKSRTGCSIEFPDPGQYYECRNANGCFATGTPILMADHSNKAIDQINVGDYVYNPYTGSSSRVASVIVGPQVKEMYEFIFANGKSLKVTYNHPMLTQKGVIMAENVKKKDQILIQGMTYTAIKEIKIHKTTEQPELVWNLSLEKDDLEQLLSGKGPFKDFQSHLISANGIVTGDHYIQTANEHNTKEYSFIDGMNASYKKVVLDGKTK